MSITDKVKVLEICEKLYERGFVTKIQENKYSVQCLVRCDEEYEEDSIFVRDRIKHNFEENGYTVDILGTYWLEVIFVDVKQRIDDCFFLNEK